MGRILRTFVSWHGRLLYVFIERIGQPPGTEIRPNDPLWSKYSLEFNNVYGRAR